MSKNDMTQGSKKKKKKENLKPWPQAGGRIKWIKEVPSKSRRVKF